MRYVLLLLQYAIPLLLFYVLYGLITTYTQTHLLITISICTIVTTWSFNIIAILVNWVITQYNITKKNNIDKDEQELLRFLDEIDSFDKKDKR